MNRRMELDAAPFSTWVLGHVHYKHYCTVVLAFEFATVHTTFASFKMLRRDTYPMRLLGFTKVGKVGGYLNLWAPITLWQWYFRNGSSNVPQVKSFPRFCKEPSPHLNMDIKIRSFRILSNHSKDPQLDRDPDQVNKDSRRRRNKVHFYQSQQTTVII